MEENGQPYRYPYIYYEIDPMRIVDLVSELLIELVRRNDDNPTALASVTRFHSRAPPSIGIHEYLTRIVKYTPIENEVLLASLVYIDRLCDVNPTFAITSLSVHRYLITAITIGSKIFCDSYCTNYHYAKVGGLTTQELNSLELEFSFLADWKLIIPTPTIHNYYLGMLRQSKKYHMIEYDTLIDPLPAPILPHQPQQHPIKKQLKASDVPNQYQQHQQHLMPHNSSNQRILTHSQSQQPVISNSSQMHQQVTINNNQIFHQQQQYQRTSQVLPHPNSYPNQVNNGNVNLYQQHYQPNFRQIRPNSNIPPVRQIPVQYAPVGQGSIHRPILPNVNAIHSQGHTPQRDQFTSTSPDDDSEEGLNSMVNRSNNAKNRASIAKS
ncbi:cyclin-domain-containing protein [Neoconidiobolus thromboides FSU 785]|nr:cyclin-domain-containing protein [Neoconidiobolus thromboides FSU 785]